MLNWFLSHLDAIAGIFLIPWGLFSVSLALTGWRKLFETSGSDIYVILASLDLEALMFRERFASLVYQGIRGKLPELFAAALVVSLFFLALSSRAQRQIAEHERSAQVPYPVGKQFFCWFIALFWMAAHFFAILGKQ